MTKSPHKWDKELLAYFKEKDSFLLARRENRIALQIHFCVYTKYRYVHGVYKHYSDEERRELANEVAVKVFRHIFGLRKKYDTSTPIGNLESYIFGVLRYELIQRRRRKEIQLLPLEGYLAQNLPCPSAAADIIAIMRDESISDVLQALAQRIEKMPVDERRVLLLAEPAFLKLFSDFDVVSEGTILEWLEIDIEQYRRLADEKPSPRYEEPSARDEKSSVNKATQKLNKIGIKVSSPYPLFKRAKVTLQAWWYRQDSGDK